MTQRDNTGLTTRKASPLAVIFGIITALLLMYVIAGPTLAQSPGASPETEAPATEEASPAGQPTELPDTATVEPGSDQSGPTSTIAFLLLIIGSIAAMFVYLRMRGPEALRQTAGSDRNPPH